MLKWNENENAAKSAAQMKSSWDWGSAGGRMDEGRGVGLKGAVLGPRGVVFKLIWQWSALSLTTAFGRVFIICLPHFAYSGDNWRHGGCNCSTNASAPPTATTKRTRAALPPPDGPQFGLHFIKVPIGMEPPNAQYKIPNTQYPIPQSRAQSASRVCVSVFHLRPSSSASSKHFAWIAFVRCYAIEVTYRHVNWQPSAEMTLLQFGRRAVIRGSTCRQVLEKSRKNFAMLKNYGFNLYLIWFNLEAFFTSNFFLTKMKFQTLREGIF